MLSHLSQRSSVTLEVDKDLSLFRCDLAKAVRHRQFGQLPAPIVTANIREHSTDF
jgi:hypothetical protein